MIVTFGQTSGAIDPIAPVLLSQKGSLFLTRPVLFHYIERRDALEASASELFEVVASGKVRINVNQRLASRMLHTPTFLLTLVSLASPQGTRQPTMPTRSGPSSATRTSTSSSSP